MPPIATTILPHPKSLNNITLMNFLKETSAAGEIPLNADVISPAIIADLSTSSSSASVSEDDGDYADEEDDVEEEEGVTTSSLMGAF